MPIGLSVALAFAAQSAAATAPAPATAPAAQADPGEADGCKRRWPNLATGEIVVCAERPKGYRIDPDIMTAKRMKRSGGRPSRPNAAGVRDVSACAVGPHPMGCQSAGINVIGAALTAAQMAARLARGEEIGSMFVTDPQMSEYQLYVAAKRAREAKEAAEAAKAAQKRATQGQTAASPAAAAAQPSP
jgi:hypothetical protein